MVIQTMWSKALLRLVILSSCLVLCDASLQDMAEARGKKIALFVYIADLLIKKFFILKLIYAFVFWCIIHKAGYFLSWFISYLKEKKEEDHHHHHHPHYEYDHHEYGPPDVYGPPQQIYGPPQNGNYGPYRKGWDN